MKATCHELLDNSYKLGPVFYFSWELLGYGVLFLKFRQQEEAPLEGGVGEREDSSPL